MDVYESTHAPILPLLDNVRFQDDSWRIGVLRIESQYGKAKNAWPVNPSHLQAHLASDAMGRPNVRHRIAAPNCLPTMRKEFPPQKTLISDSTIHRRPSFLVSSA